MARKRGGGDGGGGDSWLNTYADMVTLLLTFFIVLLSMSSTDEQKFNAFVQSFSNLPQETIDEILGNSSVEGSEDISVADSLDELYMSLVEYIGTHNQQDAIEISKINDVIYIRFSSSLFFQPDKYALLQSSIPTLNFIGGALSEHEDKIRMVNVLGFTATVDDGTYWMLSAERAAIVATHFNFITNFNPEKLTVIGYGNQYPVADNDTEEGRKQNRRVELIIVGNESAEGFDVTDALGEVYDTDTYPEGSYPNNAFRPGEENGKQPDLGNETNTNIPETPANEAVSPYDDQ